MDLHERFLAEQFSQEVTRQQVLHGSSAGVSPLDRTTFELPLRREHLNALGLSEGSVLYGTLLVPQDPERNPLSDGDEATSYQRLALPPFATLVASAVPPPAWERGLRICFSTTASGHGRMARLLRCLRKAGLYVRHLYAVSGLDSDKHAIVTPDCKLRALNTEGQRTPSQPTVVVTVEYPLEKPDEDRPIITAVHEYMKEWSAEPADYEKSLGAKIKLVKTLDAVIKAGDREASGEESPADDMDTGASFRIEWLSPLQTLRTLSACTRATETAGQAATKLRIRRSSDDPDNLCLGLAPWRRLLDPAARMSIEDSASPGPANLCAVVTVDTEERTLTAHLVPVQRYAIAQFEITHPAGRLQDLWKEWIFNEIANHEGTLLQTFSQGRLDERWARELIVCYFKFVAISTKPPTESEPAGARITPDIDRIRDIATCVRSLQAFTRHGAGGWLLADCDPYHSHSPSDALGKLNEQLTNERDFRKSDLMPPGPNSEPRLQRKDSTLRDVKLWYRWPYRSSPAYQRKFIRSKFNFTRPLTIQRWDSYYPSGSDRQARSRMRLVNRLVHLMLDQPNAERSALLLGAHRSGKTSVLNMALEKLNRPELREDLAHDLGDEKLVDAWKKKQVLGIPVNATVTPPHLLMVTIIRELRRVKNDETHPACRVAKHCYKGIKSAFKSVFGTDVSVKLASEALFPGISVSLTAPDTPPTDPVEQIRRRELKATWNSEEGRAAFLRDSMEVLRRTATKLGKETTLVIALDEVSATAAWGNSIAYPVWRNMIESKDFESVRWLLTSTRPLTEATDYSPLGNAVREFSMRPLSEYEADCLISNFDLLDPDDASSSGEFDRERNVPLVVTYEAREYLKWLTGRFPYFLQVVCAHVYERTVAYHIPVISQSLLRHIIRLKVIPELSDFFTTQRRLLSEALLDRIAAAVADTEDPLKHRMLLLSDVSATERRELQLAGLGWREGTCIVVPLFAHWLWAEMQRS